MSASRYPASSSILELFRVLGWVAALVALSSCGGLCPFGGVACFGGLTLTPSQVTLSVAQTRAFTASNGTAPYVFTLTGLGQMTTQTTSTVLFAAPWSVGASTIQVRDALGRTASASIAHAPGALQIGGMGSLSANAVRVTSGGAVLLGSDDAIAGNLVGTHGLLDAVIARIDANGQLKWFEQFGGGAGRTTTFQRLVEDTTTGDFYVQGDTAGVVGTQFGTHGGTDAVVARFRSDGTLVWISQLGCGGGLNVQTASFLVDSSGVYLVGTTGGNLGGIQFGVAGTSDWFAARFDNATGAVAFASQRGNGTNVFISRAALSGSGVYVSGETGSQLMVASYDTSGNETWFQSIATPGGGAFFDLVMDLSGNLYLSGWSGTVLNAVDGAGHGSGDAILIKYDPAGVQQWVRQIGAGGASNSGIPGSLSLEGTDLFLTAQTTGIMGGNQYGVHSTAFASQGDFFIARYTTAGVFQWVTQAGSGTTSWNYVEYAKSDGAGGAYIAGHTVLGAAPATFGGTMEGTSGGVDCFVAHLGGTGASQWFIQIGSESAGTLFPGGFGTGVSGEILIAGTASAQLTTTAQLGTHGSTDLYLASYSTAGTRNWAIQMGAGGASASNGSVLFQDTAGNIYLDGFTDSLLPGTLIGTHGTRDSVLLKLDPSGNLQ